MSDRDPHDLQRFVEAQDAGGVYEQALGELRRGRKQGHWMWFVFPQLRGLGSSRNARLYGIGSLDEARAYLAHPVLGTRLIECTEAVLAAEGRSAEAILGSTDAVKLRSSMTLFAQAAPEQIVFSRVLERFFDDSLDARTLDRL
jgi:uncharacterized protein (DUF1810 family)